MKQSATFDSSFWINAHRAGLTEAVLDVYELTCAPDVAFELTPNYPSGSEFWRLQREGRIRVERPVGETIREFGRGERAALNLAIEHPDWQLLIDDRRPFAAAVARGLWAVCTPALTVDLFRRGRLTDTGCLAALARLAALQTVSPVLLAAAAAELEGLLQNERSEKP